MGDWGTAVCLSACSAALRLSKLSGLTAGVSLQLALARLDIAIVGALGPTNWASAAKTTTALRGE